MPDFEKYFTKNFSGDASSELIAESIDTEILDILNI